MFYQKSLEASKVREERKRLERIKAKESTDEFK